MTELIEIDTTQSVVVSMTNGDELAAAIQSFKYD